MQSILASDRIEDADGYQAYLAAAGFAPARITDHAEQTVVATTRAFRSERYRNRSRAYCVVYFGVVFALVMPAAYWLWEQMFRRGHARYVFLYSERRDPRAQRRAPPRRGCRRTCRGSAGCPRVRLSHPPRVGVSRSSEP